MKCPIHFIAAAGLCFLLLCQVDALTQDKSKNQTAGTGKGWTARIVSARQPEGLNVEEPNAFGGPPLRFPTSAPKDKKWLLLDVELKCLAEKGKDEAGQVGVPIESLGVAEDSSQANYSLYALGFGGEDFSILTRVAGFLALYKVRMSQSGAMIAQAEIEGKKTIVVVCSKNAASRFLFLFPVAEGTKQFYFHIGNDYFVPVQINQ